MRCNFTPQADAALLLSKLELIRNEISDSFLLNYDQMNDLLTVSQEIEIALRSKILEYIAAEEYQTSQPIKTSSLIPSVAYEDNTLKIFTPLTFSRGTPDCYLIATAVSQAIKQFERENNIRLFQLLDPPLQCVILRNVHKFSGRLRDNDNSETGRIINTVFSSLGLSDNCQILRDYHCGFRIVSEDVPEGMHFYIFEEQHSCINMHLLYDTEKSPIK